MPLQTQNKLMHRLLLVLQVASLMAANPTIPLSGVAAGETFTIPCKPEQNCCPFYLYAAPNGTGKPLLEILLSQE